MLDGLTREMKLAAMEYRAENHTLADTYDWLYVNYPHAERYTLNTFKAWSRSPEGKNDYKAASKRIKEEAGKGFGVSENRILAVMEVTMKILGKLRSLEA